MKNKKILLILLGFIIIFLDQLTKVILLEKNFTIIPNVINITYTENTGVAFGIGSSNIFMIIILNIIILGFIIKFIKEQQEQVDLKILIPLILILSGGISNLIDRIFRGYVIDFIDVNFFNFPNFNIADISISIGIISLIFILCNSILKEKNAKE